MPSWTQPQVNNPSPGDNEVTSLWKIADLCRIWAANKGKIVSIPWLGGNAPSPHDNEAISLQKINASLAALAK